MKTIKGDGYKYLGILEYDDLLHYRINNKLKSE